MQLTQASLSSANPVSFALERMTEGETQNERQKDKNNINFISMLCWGFHQCLISLCSQAHTYTDLVQLMFAKHS